MKFTRSLAAEEKIILQLTRPLPSKSTSVKTACQFVPQNNIINQTKLFEISERNGVASLLYLRNKKLGLIAEKLREEFQELYFKTAAKNLRKLHETLGIITLLSNHDIGVVPLKGAIASELLFENLGLYPSGDIDILVHPSQLERASGVLCKEGGYVQEEAIKEEDLLSNHYHLMFRKDNQLLEVHWNLVKRYFFIPPDFWWHDAISVPIEDVFITELAIEKYLLYLIFRLFDHGFYPLKFFVLLATLIDKKHLEINWEKLIRYSTDYKMKKLVIITLKLLNDFFETNVPPEIITKKIAGYKIFQKLIIGGIFSGIKRPHLRMMIYVLMLDQKSSILKILLGRIFPSKSELRLRYHLEPNSIKVFYYYVLNPFLLFKKR